MSLLDRYQVGWPVDRAAEGREFRSSDYGIHTFDYFLDFYAR